MTGDKRQGSPGVSPLLGGSFRRALRAEALRRDELPRTAAPAPAAAGPRRHARCRATRAGPGRHARAECADRRAKGHSHRDGTPRIVQVGPSSVKGTRRSFLTASQKGSSGPTLERRSLCRPSGPDGEGQARGQARNARGEPKAAQASSEESNLALCFAREGARQHRLWRDSMATQAAPEDQRAELADQRRRVDFDTYDVTVDELLRRVARKRIDIAPVYQRQFRWDSARQSRRLSRSYSVSRSHLYLWQRIAAQTTRINGKLLTASSGCDARELCRK